MNNDEDTKLEHEAVLGYLPLFVNKSLDDTTSALVASHVESCDQCQLELALERSLQGSIKQDKDVSHLARSNLAKLNAQIDEMSGSVDNITKPDGLMIDRIKVFFQSLLPTSPILGGAMAVGLCAVVAVGVLRAPDTINDYPGTTRGEQKSCESSHAESVQKFEYRISHRAENAALTTQVGAEINKLLPTVTYKIERAGENEITVALDVTTCDSTNHKLKRQLEDNIDGVESVKMRNLSLASETENH